MKITGTLDHGEVRLKIAQLRIKGMQDFATNTLKVAFVPSPQVQGQVEQQAQQTGQEPQQGPSGQAVAPSGITLDEVAGMVDQAFQQMSPQLADLDRKVVELTSMVQGNSTGQKGSGGGGGGGGGGGEDTADLESRIGQLEEMLQAAGYSPPPPAADGEVPVPAQPSATPPPSQTQPQQPAPAVAQ